MNILKITAAFALGLAFNTAARAQQQTFQVDPATSQVQFTLEATLHAVHGTFHVQQGSIVFSPTGEMSGSIVVDPASGDSGEASRDKKMRQDELKADKYTSVTFAPKSYTGQLAPTGDSNIVVHGVFTLLGTPHVLDVPMHVHLAPGACEATGTFAVPFVQWGVKDPSTFMLKVGKEVTVNLDLKGKLTSAS